MAAEPQPAEDIFYQAIELEAEARQAFLAQACAENPQLRDEVERLLADHLRAGDFLDKPAAVVTTAALPITEGAGTAIGRYKLLEQIGEGGFGIVFMAEQEAPVRRKVALKIIKPGMDSKEVIARFEAERQALALMDHPNIARVFDAGATETGRPYFVMELVRGIPITAFCDKCSLGPRERLGLFVKVCQAVQHAHQKGVIHRDIKPSNVLVTMHDDEPVPKVIDFGVAKATNARLTDRTLFTRFAQMIGTPLYMSPEQAQMSGLDIDTRSDIYSLGVLLYELLTGTTPFDRKRVREAAQDELLRIIREEEPPKPSLRISSLGDTLPSVAARRKVEPKKLSAILRGDLDWIVMKAIEKDRRRRYQTAAGMAADIARYLNDETVEARPPSQLYRLQKLLRRNKGIAIAVTTVAAALVLGMLGLLFGYLKSNAALQEAIKARQVTIDQSRHLRHQKYISDMNVAAQAWRDNDVRRVTQILREYVPTEAAEDLRGFEWFLLSRYCRQNRVSETISLPYTASSLAYSPQKRLVAVAIANNSVVLFDRADRTLRTLRTGGRVWYQVYVAMSQDGKTLVFPDDVTSNITVMDLPSNRTRLLSWTNDVTAVALSDDARLLVSGDTEGKIVVWSLESGEPVTPAIVAHSGQICALTFSPDNSTLATCSDRDHEVKIWNAKDLTVKGTHDRHYSSAQSVAFTPDGKTLVSGGSDGEIILWDIGLQKCKATLRGHSDAVRSLVFSSGGKRLLSAGRDKTVALWDMADRSPLLEKKFLSAGRATFLDDETIASVSFDGTLDFWRLDSVESERELKLDDVCIDIAFTADSRCLVAVQRSPRKVVLCDVESRRVIEEIDKSCVRVVDVSDTGIIAMGGDDGVIRVKYPDGKQTGWQAHRKAIWQIAFSPDGKYVASLGLDNAVKVWEVNSQRACREWYCGSPNARPYDCGPLAFSPGGTILATADAGNSVLLFDLEGEQQMARRLAQHKTTVFGVDFSPDGKMLASASWDGMVQLNETAPAQSRTPPLTLPHPLWVKTLAFTPDGTSLVTVCGDRRLRFWDVAEQQQRCSFDAPGMESMEFSPNGLMLAGGVFSGLIGIWQRDRADAGVAP